MTTVQTSLQQGPGCDGWPRRACSCLSRTEYAQGATSCNTHTQYSFLGAVCALRLCSEESEDSLS